MVKRSAPDVYVDIAPLLDPGWTGIPVFTRRLILALTSQTSIRVGYSYKGLEISASLIEDAISMHSGALIRAEIDGGSAFMSLTFPSVPSLNPTTKGASPGISPREASTVHDLSTLLMPEVHGVENVAHHLDNFVEELDTNELTFCVSKYTQDTLHLYYPSTQGRSNIIAQYVDWHPNYELADYNLAPPAFGRYALVIGTIEPRKNLKVVFDAAKRNPALFNDLAIVIVGRQGWLTEKALESLSGIARDRIFFSGFVSEFVKYRLLKHCEFLIYPSMYEGFGIPALEALSLGKTVLSAKSSSLCEVVGDAGLFFDPFSPDEFSDAFASLLSKSRSPILRQRALEQSLKFSARRMVAPVAEWLTKI